MYLLFGWAMSDEEISLEKNSNTSQRRITRSNQSEEAKSGEYEKKKKK
jgi:hypothetical protein